MFQDVTKECPAILFSTWQWLVLCIWCPGDKYTPFLCLWNDIIWNMDANLFVKSVAGRNIRMSFKIIQFFTFIILWAEYNFRWYLGNIYHSVIHIYIFLRFINAPHWKFILRMSTKSVLQRPLLRPASTYCKIFIACMTVFLS